MIKPVVLWTDGLLFLLTVLVVVFVFYARRKPHIRRPWRRIFRGRIAAASVVVLAAFVLVGLLDSMHYRLPLDDNGTGTETHYAVEVLSVLDAMMGPLRTNVEKSYSAPFATHLYIKENVDLPNGGQARVHPRLQHGGRHLGERIEDKPADIAWRSGLSVLQGVLAGLLLSLLLAWLLGRKHGTTTLEMIGPASMPSSMTWHVAPESRPYSSAPGTGSAPLKSGSGDGCTLTKRLRPSSSEEIGKMKGSPFATNTSNATSSRIETR